MNRPTVDNLRRGLDYFIPFLFGMIVGVLTAYAQFNGDMRALQVTSSAHSAAIVALQSGQRQTHDLLVRIAERLHVETGPGP